MIKINVKKDRHQYKPLHEENKLMRLPIYVVNEINCFISCAGISSCSIMCFCIFRWTHYYCTNKCLVSTNLYYMHIYLLVQSTSPSFWHIFKKKKRFASMTFLYGLVFRIFLKTLNIFKYFIFFYLMEKNTAYMWCVKIK